MEANVNVPNIREKVVFLVRQTRAMAGFNRKEMAAFLGTGPEIVRNWERGLTVPRADMFLAVMELRRRILRANRYEDHPRKKPADQSTATAGGESRDDRGAGDGLCETLEEVVGKRRLG